MSMYTILCEKDGTERWVRGDLESAVKSMKEFATLNGDKNLERKQITFLRPTAPKVVEQYEAFVPPKKEK